MPSVMSVRSWSLRAALGLLLAWAASVARAQDIPELARDVWKQRWTEPYADGRRSPNSTALANVEPGRAARIALFRMPTGFLSEPITISSDDPPSEAANFGVPSEIDDFQRRIQVSLGMDRPFFDLYRRGDPGGFGYYRLHSQYQLFDTGTAAMTLGLQAATPAGLESEGVAQGPTYFSPNVAWYQELGGGVAAQGFFGKNFRANADTVGHLPTGLHYGVALQCPVPGLCDESNRGLFVFVEGLGRYRYDDVLGSGRATWDIVPGLHYRLRDDFWISLAPMRSGLLTCSWRF